MKAVKAPVTRRSSRTGQLLPMIFLVSSAMALTVVPQGNVLAQDLIRAEESTSAPARHVLGLGIGLADLHFRDAYLSPTGYQGRFFAPVLRYRLDFGNTSHEFEGSFSVGSLDPEHQYWSMTVYQGSFRYLAVFGLADWTLAGMPANLSWGAGLGSAAGQAVLDVSIPGYISSDRDQSWYWAHSVLLHVRNGLHLSKSLSLDVQVSAPIFSLVTRPADGHWLNAKNMEVMESFWRAATRGRRAFPWEDPMVDGSVELQSSPEGGLGFWVRYGFTYTSFDLPAMRRSFTHTFQGGCTIPL